MKTNRQKIPRGRCYRCGKRKYTPGMILYNDYKNIQGICLKCMIRVSKEESKNAS